MKIYRLQYKNGLGCYSYGTPDTADFNKLMFLHVGCVNHPTLYYDEILRSKSEKFKNMRFACNSKEQFMKWFDNIELREMIVSIDDLEILEIDIDDKYVAASNYQCIYEENKVNQIISLNKEDFFC